MPTKRHFAAVKKNSIHQLNYYSQLYSLYTLIILEILFIASYCCHILQLLIFNISH